MSVEVVASMSTALLGCGFRSDFESATSAAEIYFVLFTIA
jgi:hypothetical protein